MSESPVPEYTQTELDFATFLATTTANARRASGGAFLRRNQFIASPRVTWARRYDAETERLRAQLHNHERKAS